MNATLQRFLDKLTTRESKIAIIGLGYVGLPLAVAFGESGIKVIGIDLDTNKVTQINNGCSYVEDVSESQLADLVKMGYLGATTHFEVLADVDAVIVCVPTPLSKTKDPDMSYIIAATDQIAQYVHTGQLIVLESTTYPGTTEEIILPRIVKNGYKVGEDFFLSFSPERIDPGRTDYTVRTTPKVIGGMTPNCLTATQALYSTAIDTIIPVSSPKAAEMVKLLENTFRAVNIGLVNEVALMCDKLGLNVWEIIDAASTKPYGFTSFYPGPGLGGHCIPIDPRYLSWKLQTLNYRARFIEIAEEINFGMPQYVVSKVTDALNEAGKPIKGSRIFIMGVAYKANIGDLRESPALDIIELLLHKGAEIAYHDPYVPSFSLNGHNFASVNWENALAHFDCVVIATNHRIYDWQTVAQKSSVLVDTRNALKGVEAAPGTIIRL
ncbi:MAG: nucleotide sugar dehydrogenase [Anaerolineales bacterium]|nr:nucleotide sugar dehydrogenase [Anaerolineales bacterium]